VQRVRETAPGGMRRYGTYRPFVEVAYDGAPCRVLTGVLAGYSRGYSQGTPWSALRVLTGALYGVLLGVL
jgi:hypothetical protein